MSSKTSILFIISFISQIYPVHNKSIINQFFKKRNKRLVAMATQIVYHPQIKENGAAPTDCGCTIIIT